MRTFAARSVFVLTLLLILGSSVYLGLRATFPDSRPEQGPRIGEPLPYVPHVIPPSRTITLEEARAMAPFKIPTPAYLPNNMPLARVEVEEVRGLGDRFYLIYSHEPPAWPLDPGGAIIVMIDYCYGNPPSDEWIDNFIKFGPAITVPGRETLYPLSNVFKDVRIKGIRGIGSDLDAGAKYASVLWWMDGLRLEVIGRYPLEGLVKVAESMVILRPVDENVPQYAVSISITPWDGGIVPGLRLTYIAKVTNEGRMADNYALSVVDALGWGLSIFPPSPLEIPPGESRFVIVSVAIPENALPGIVNDITVTATSSTGLTISKPFKYAVKVESR